MPTSLVNVNAPHVYSKGDSALAGFLVWSDAAEVFCSYYVDGQTMSKTCDPPGMSRKCVPGCPTGHPGARWCGDRTQSDCAWPSERLDQMLLQQQEMAKGSYNEVVLSAETWVDNMPNTVLAVFYLARARPEQVAHARQVHGDFLKRYRLPSSQVPLIEYNENAGARTPAFRLAPAR